MENVGHSGSFGGPRASLDGRHEATSSMLSCHSQGFCQSQRFENVVRHLEHVVDTGPIESLDQEGDQAPDCGRLPWDQCFEPDPAIGDIDPEIDGGLTFLNTTLAGNRIGRTLGGQGRERVGELDQQFESVSSVQPIKFGKQRLEFH